MCACRYVEKRYGFSANDVSVYTYVERERERDRKTARVCMMKHHGFSANAMCDYDYIQRNQREKDCVCVYVCVHTRTFVPERLCMRAYTQTFSLCRYV